MSDYESRVALCFNSRVHLCLHRMLTATELTRCTRSKQQATALSAGPTSSAGTLHRCFTGWSSPANTTICCDPVRNAMNPVGVAATPHMPTIPLGNDGGSEANWRNNNVVVLVQPMAVIGGRSSSPTVLISLHSPERRCERGIPCVDLSVCASTSHASRQHESASSVAGKSKRETL